ncbi:DUF5977 domain-containing protein [Flavihumibacter sp. ZG627]|uniref:DUF5977 domain-containing protein n=1 Tax=Flavihumibacter sp. ZG627 TaxID=1463156 RepID=UPI00057FFD8F|nr:DUF5977 domain-containing protein [Flavihumibacter sp. ZG627]KIC89215.1 hypothetical protein HY58_18360 [Flavihumibacter sp. ZG627]
MPWMDSEYDIFSYSIGDKSGKIIFEDSNNVKKPVWIPQVPYLVSINFNDTELSTISITDDKGIMYFFIPGETYSSSMNSARSAWVLEKIISNDKVDTISLTYLGASEVRTTISQTATLIDQWNMIQEQFPLVNPEYSVNESSETYSISRVSSIKFKGNVMNFKYLPNNTRIQSVEVVNKNNEVIKDMRFYSSMCYSQSEIGTSTNKLDSIVFNNRNGARNNKYAFEYYALASSNGQLNLRHQDWWGYYNNSGLNDFVPRYTNLYYVGSGGPGVINVGNPSANREPDLAGLKSGVLKKITYPTGGYTEYIYEHNLANLFGISGTPRKGPGLRIQQINNSDSVGQVYKKQYKYGVNENGYGIIDAFPDISTMSKEMSIGFMNNSAPLIWSPDRGGSYRIRTFSSDINTEVSELFQRPVIYNEVTEYEGTNSINTGKVVLKYDYSPWALNGMPSLSPLIIGKKHIKNFNYYRTPSLISKTVFKQLNNQYYKIQELINIYNLTTTDTITGLHIQRNLSFPQTGQTTAYHPDYTSNVTLRSEEYATFQCCFGVPLGPTPNIFTFDNYQIITGVKNLKNSISIQFLENGDSMGTSTSFEYNSKNLLSKEATINSLGDTISKVTKYPFDYNTPINNQMAAINMLNFPYEEVYSKNSSILNSYKTEYINIGTSIQKIYPQSVYKKFKSDTYKPILRFHSYNDYGKPISVSKENDVIISYLWDYKNTLPIAEVTNSDIGDIAYTSFEAEGKGGWLFNGTCSIDLSAPTGKMVYDLTGGNITKSVIATKNYYLTYWRPSSETALNISGTQTGYPLIGTSINGWKKIVHKIYGSTNISLAGLGKIDEVRLHPENSQMRTYTHTPLIGITSEGDHNGNLTYYDYDSMGNLYLVKNESRSILKKFCYNYSGQLVSCDPFYNDDKSGTYSRSNCASGYTGGSYYVNIPAGMFSSTVSKADANNQATAYGQAQANIYGACTSSTVSLLCNNNVSNGTFFISFFNESTGASYNFTSSYGYGVTLGSIPAGNYTISITPTRFDTMYFYTAGCYTYGGGYDYTFYSIPINSTCRSIEISY